MPVGTVDLAKTEKFPLKSAPGDENAADVLDQPGFVVLRALPYGMKLARRDKATKMSMKSQGSNAKKNEASEISLENYNEWAVAYDFTNCIVDHNICDQNRQKLDFSNSMAIKLLDPKIGSEIERLINSLNEDEDEEMVKDFPSPLTTSLTTEQNDLATE